ncbi:hypothetical protein T484DRAFT_1851865 [Baffinella frigidus]|nr:hypothetical protein T484DRAFT_1851865 [Cryptophyta sp. CCMP2293]
MYCKISGLVSQPHQNGKRCELQKFEEEKKVEGGAAKGPDRWVVLLEDGTSISLRPGNLSPAPLEKGTQCDISGLVSTPMLNGRRGRLEQFENGRWTVLLDDGKTYSLEPSNLSAALAPIKKDSAGNDGAAKSNGGNGGAAKKRKLEESDSAEKGAGGGSAGGGKAALAKETKEKKPIVGYNLLKQHTAKDLKKTLPKGTSAAEVARALGEVWKNLPEEEMTAWKAGNVA